MTPRRLSTFLAGAVALAALGIALVALAPTQIGGRTGYVVTAGTSMEPAIHAGDLVVTRAHASYEIGDVVLYRSRELDRNVLHRIVAQDGPRVVVKGDNNGYRDADHPTPDRIVGALWFRVPGVGRPLAALKRPAVFAFLVFLLAFGALVGGRVTSRDRRRAPNGPAAGISTGAASTVAVGAAAALALFAVIAVAAWTRPVTSQVTVADAWAHTGTFAYGADVRRSAVYPTGRVTTGDTVFTRLVRRLEVAFTYRFESRGPADVRGGVGLDAVVSDGQGWSRRVPLAPEEPFSGSAARVSGTIDLRAVRALVERMRRLTGSTATLFTVSLAPTVQLAGYTGATVVDERYEPTVALQLDATGLRPAAEANGAAVDWEVRKSGSIVASAPSSLRLGPVALAVDRARVLGGLGVAVSLLVALGALLWALTRQRDSATAIRDRFGRRVVEAEIAIPEDRWVTDIATADELARIAEHYDRVVLHAAERGGDVYLVDDGVAVYRFTAPSTGVSFGAALPARGR